MLSGMAFRDLTLSLNRMVGAQKAAKVISRSVFAGVLIVPIVLLLVFSGIWFVFGKTILPSRIASVIEAELGHGRTVQVGSGTLSDITFSSATLHVGAIDILEEDGATVAHIPNARVALEGNLIFGRPVIRRIDVTGATLALAIAEDGSVSVRGINQSGGRMSVVRPLHPLRQFFWLPLRQRVISASIWFCRRNGMMSSCPLLPMAVENRAP